MSPGERALKIESVSEEHAQEPTRADELFAAGCLVLERRYSDPGLTAQAVGEAIGVSEKTVFRIFAHVGFKVELLRLRMEEAERLLERSSHSVATVARLSGFSSASAFSLAFRRAHGATSPGAWRAGRGGRRRAGPATGAAYRPAARARARHRGENFFEPPHFDLNGHAAILDAELREAQERLRVRHPVRGGVSIAELTREMHPELYTEVDSDELAPFPRAPLDDSPFHALIDDPPSDSRYRSP